METFEQYAERVISGLSDPEIVDTDQLRSPLEGAFDDLNDQLIKISEASQIPTLGSDISSEDINDIENGILASGLEALAFYKSIHYKSAPPFRGEWGIFIYDHALSYLSQEINNYYPKKYTLSECLEKSFWLLYFHERFHFRFDSWAISQESATGKPLYVNYRNSVYRSFHPLIFIYEESLANLHSLSSVSRHGIYEYAKQFMLNQPGAYSNIIGIDRNEFKSKLAAQLFHGRGQFLGVPVLTLPEHSHYLATPENAASIDRQCPIFIVQGISASRFIVPNISLPAVSEIEKKYLKKYLSGKESRTDHKYFIIDNGEKIKCPNPHNKNLRLHEFTNIVKKSGLTTNEYFEERARTKVWKKDVPRNTPKPSLLREMA